MIIIKRQQKNSQFNLTVNQVDKIINSADTFRDKLIIESLYYPALRRNEVVDLQISDIDFDSGRITITGKYDKQRVIPVGTLYPSYVSNLRIFLKNRLKGFVFMSNRQKPFNDSRINQIVQRAGENAKVSNPNPKLKHINPHLFRHSQTRHLKNAGSSMEFVKDYLGHKSIKTTMDTYGQPSLQDIETEAKKLRGVLQLDS